ncbi:MAG: hypothetical protein IKM59_04060 [Oscillospiraceae bacterium]|nr:hypothetical protein [Oscillospiraceae bacterium]
MKVEQACRFRMDEGYCICAKSDGLKPSQEASFGDAFNSTMNDIFPDFGYSILSCMAGKNEVFLARSTLRTDVLGRKTIYTHTYVMPSEDYAKSMEENPGLMLSIPMDRFMDAHNTGSHLEQLELKAPAKDTMDIARLFEKYQLTPARYGKLMMGAYEAMTGNGSLRLFTDLPMQKTEEMVRELTYCIVAGLLPVLRGKVSFSSGADPRMTISVLPREYHGEMKSTDIVFGVENDRFTNIRPKDEISAMFFEALGKASHEERRKMLMNMQSWLNEVVNVQDGLSVMLVATAYCLSSGQELSQNTSLTLFKSISNTKGFSTRVANALLTGLVKMMNSKGGCSSNALSFIAEWYLKDSTAAYQDEADRAFAGASVDICVALAEAVLAMPMTDNIRRMLLTLLRNIPAESGLLSKEAQNKVVLWIMGENVEAFSDYAAAMVLRYEDSQILELVRGLLASAQTRSLSASEKVMLIRTLERMKDARICLNDADGDILDKLSPAYSPEMMTCALKYLILVRFPAKGAEGGHELLEKIASRYPRYFEEIKKYFSRGINHCMEIWERYQANHCFRNKKTLIEIANTCREYNVFENPCGVFERTAGEMILELVNEDFLDRRETAQIKYYVTVLMRRWMDAVQALRVSPKMQQKIKLGIIDKFWTAITYKQIWENDSELPDFMRNAPAEMKQKLELVDLCLGLRRNPTDTGRWVDLITSPNTPEEYRWLLLKSAGNMMSILVSKRILVWDLALLTCWKDTEDGGEVDLEKFLTVCEGLERTVGRKKAEFYMDASDSILLRDETLSKSITKMGGKLPAVLEMLIEQLNSQKKGFLRGLFGGSSKDKRSSDTRSFGQYAADSKRRSGKHGEFDPTDPDNLF